MGLLINKELSNGATASYWRLESCHAKSNKTAIAEVFGYVSKEARIDGKERIVSQFFEIPFDKNCQDPLWEETYEGLKQIAFFSGAINDI